MPDLCKERGISLVFRQCLSLFSSKDVDRKNAPTDKIGIHRVSVFFSEHCSHLDFVGSFCQHFIGRRNKTTKKHTKTISFLIFALSARGITRQLTIGIVST